MKKAKAPGKFYRQGISLIQLFKMFPDEESAEKWFESVLWPDERCCGHCGSVKTNETPKRRPQPYWCSDCRRYFSVRTGTTLARSHVPLQKWALAIFIYITNLKGVSSMKLHRDIDVTQATAWFMLHRLRQSWTEDDSETLSGPVEIDETYIGGKRRNMSAKRRAQFSGRGSVGKVAVVGMKDRPTNQIRARVVPDTTKATLSTFILENSVLWVRSYTDENPAYDWMGHRRESVKHTVGEYVRGMAHTNGMESFWSMLKRGYTGTFHKMSEKHLHRYVSEFAKRHNIRELDTIDQMKHIVAGLVGRRLMYLDLTADDESDESQN